MCFIVFIINPGPRCVGGGLQYLVGLCVCMSVCLSATTKLLLSSIISKYEHATALNLCKAELAILLFYKTGYFLKAQATWTAHKFGECKSSTYRDEMKCLCNKTKALIDIAHDIRKIYVRICVEMCAS